MRVLSLASGSLGNCSFVSTANTNIIVDCGISASKAVSNLGESGIQPNVIDAILITHEHSDHINGAFVLARRLGVPVYINPETYSASKQSHKNVDVRLFDTDELFSIGNIDIHPFPVSHDAADPVGFSILSDEGNVVIATDTGIVTEKIAEMAQNASVLMLEFNHDCSMLENGLYPRFLKNRVAGDTGHLSNIDAAKLLSSMDRSNLKSLFLVHLSRSNNLPKLAHENALKAIEDDSQRIDILVGDQYLIRDFSS